MGDVIIRHANYGLELVDELTGGPLVGSSVVTFAPTGPSVPSVGPVVFNVGSSRWVFENLAQEMLFTIQAEHYLSQELETGVDLPAVPPDNLPGVLAEIKLKPRPGYPFQGNLTRLIGSVRLDPSVDATTPIVDGADVIVTPRHSASSGVNFETRTDETGQYAVWFEPDPTLTPQWATGYTVAASAVVGGIPRAGTLSLQSLVLQAFNAAPTILLS